MMGSEEGDSCGVDKWSDPTIFEGRMNEISDGLEMGVRDREEFMC